VCGAPLISPFKMLGGVDDDLREKSTVHRVDKACATVCSGGQGASLTAWTSTDMGLLRSMEPHERAQWDGVVGTLETLAPL